MDEPAPSFAERWLDVVCRFRYVFYIVFIVLTIFLVLAVASAVSGAPSDADTRAILLLDFVLIGVALSIVGGLIALCRWFGG